MPRVYSILSRAGRGGGCLDGLRGLEAFTSSPDEARPGRFQMFFRGFKFKVISFRHIFEKALGAGL